jgi:two-component system CheB/CheR fusion protein
LETSRQELVTVNAELQDKVMALSHAQSDLENLLASTEIAIIFLDKDLCVRRFTPPATAIVNLIEADIGRPLAHIASTLEYDDMVEDAQRVQDTLSIQKTEVQAKDGGWYQMQIRPYRTVDDVIDGVVITFTDIIEQKELQEELRKARDYAQDIVATVREPLLVLDGDLRITTASRSFRRFFKVTQEDVEGKLIYKMGNGQWDIPELRELLEHILPEDESFEDFEVQHDFPGIGERTMLLNARRIVSQDGQPHLILLAMEEMENNEKE